MLHCGKIREVLVMKTLTTETMKTLTPEEMQQISGGVDHGERPFPEADVYLFGLRTETGAFRFVVLTEQGLPFLATGGRLR
jgi:bacteriocin-like protein